MEVIELKLFNPPGESPILFSAEFATPGRYVRESDYAALLEKWKVLDDTLRLRDKQHIALLERHRRLVDQVKRITNHEAYKAVLGTQEFAKDARYTWPNRYKWITDLLEAALAEEVE